MPLTKLLDEVENISKLSDEPNDNEGLTAAELKAEFDKAGKTIKLYLNDTLVMELDAKFAAQAAENKKLEDAIADLVAVSIPDGSVTEAKLADQSVSHRVLGLNAVESSNIKDGAVGERELATNAVTVDKILAKAVTDVKLADKSVTHRTVAEGAVWDGNIKEREVKERAFADGAVSTRALATNSVTSIKISNGSITNEKLGDGAVTGAKISEEFKRTLNPKYDFGKVEIKPGTPSNKPNGTLYFQYKV